jgi:hypothetical protein
LSSAAKLSTGGDKTGREMNIQPIAEDVEENSGNLSSKVKKSKKLEELEDDYDDDINRSPDPIDQANIEISQPVIKPQPMEQDVEPV